MKSLAPLVLFLTASAGALADTPDYRFDFENVSKPDRFTEADWTVQDPAGVAFVQGEQRAMADDSQAHSGRQSLRAWFPASSVGPSQGGYQAAVLLESARQYCLSYWLRFDESFSWGGAEQGGKLPGLGQGELCSGGDSCNGHNGFTARYMWRRDGAAVLYLYHMDKPDKWGEDFPLLDSGGEPLFFPRGEWIHLQQHVQINHGDAADGEIRVWMNGEEALTLDGLRFVSDGSGIDTFYFSTFHGGNTAEWGPLNDSYLWVDDISAAPTDSCH